MEKLIVPLDILRDIAKGHNCYDIAAPILNDSRFPIWSGSSKKGQHHYGKGGLAQHTMEVVHLCAITSAYQSAILKRKINYKLLYLAALYHDVGKMWDYEPQPQWNQPLLPSGESAQYIEWQGNDHKRNIHHISRSAITLVKNNQQIQALTNDEEDEVVHAILAHHGLREWGSPISPNSSIAWILHYSDGISARLNETVK